MQRCSVCRQPGHKRTAHQLYNSRPQRTIPPGWYVTVTDISGALDAWYGPLHWSVACALVRLLETRLPRRSKASVSRRTAAMHGEPTPLPDGWQDYDPIKTQRVRRLSPPTYDQNRRNAA